MSQYQPGVKPVSSLVSADLIQYYNETWFVTVLAKPRSLLGTVCLSLPRIPHARVGKSRIYISRSHPSNATRRELSNSLSPHSTIITLRERLHLFLFPSPFFLPHHHHHHHHLSSSTLIRPTNAIDTRSRPIPYHTTPPYSDTICNSHRPHRSPRQYVTHQMKQNRHHAIEYPYSIVGTTPHHTPHCVE